MQDLKELILDKLKTQKFPSLISEVIVTNKRLTILLALSNSELINAESIKQEIKNLLTDITSIEEINFIVTNSSDFAKRKIIIPNIDKIILVSSGKGGVGKSTIAVALAGQLSNEGHKVGILDADIYGPSVPTILGINGENCLIENNKFIPIVKGNISIMSSALIIKNQDDALAFRGPMATKLLYKLLGSTDWPSLDYLIIDMPPGTGDIHLSLLENYIITGAIIVTTPQKIATQDVARLLNLYKKFDVNIYGLVNNMSNFPGDGFKKLAEQHNLPIIANVEFLSEISKSCDEGSAYYKLLPRICKF